MAAAETAIEDDSDGEGDVEDSIVVKRNQPPVLKTLLTGLPYENASFWTIVSFLVNISLVLMMLDLTFRASYYHPAIDLSFARLGYVSDTCAKLLVREIESDHYPIRLAYRYADSPLFSGRTNPQFESAWKRVDTIADYKFNTDFTTTFIINGLQPDTRYQFAFSNNHSGHFITAPPLGQLSSRRNAPEHFTFFHTSCIKAFFPYTPFSHALNVPGFRHLAPWLEKLKPAFMLFLGDFIYADVPRRQGDDKYAYRTAYRQVYASPDWPGATTTSTHSIPWIHTYDDHEIANDWSGNTTGLFEAAWDPYTRYHLAPNPGHLADYWETPDNAPPSYFTFDQGPASFFVLDTRRYRSPPNISNAHDPSVYMLGRSQRSALLSWIHSPPLAPNMRFKFLVSSVPFTANWRVNAQDTWAGYLAERHVLLQAMWRASATHGVAFVVLSGDRHEFAATEFPPPRGSAYPPGVTVTEFSCSPLSMFYLPVRTYKQEDMNDVAIKYIPKGNSKFGVVEIGRPTGSGQGVLTYRLFVDGVEKWSHVLTAGGEVDGVSLASNFRKWAGDLP